VSNRFLEPIRKDSSVISSFLIVRSSDPAALWIACAVGFVAGIVLFIRGFRMLQRRRLILDTPFSKIRSASMGMVEVSGLAVGPYTMNAPLTGRPCYYYRTNAWEYKQVGKNKEWVKVATESMHLPFFVDDNTGRVLVDPRGADLDLHCDFKEEFCNSIFTIHDAAPPSVNSFLSRYGIATDNKIKVEEFCIKPKNALFILGTLAENSRLQITSHPMPDDEIFEPASPTSSSSTSLLSPNAISFTMRMRSTDPDPNLVTQGPVSQSDAARPEVIRLSTGSASLKTADMTQQQKIAAALVKAGIGNPAAWSAAGLAAPHLQVQPDPSAHAQGNGGNGNGSNGGLDSAASGFDPHPPVVLKKGDNNKNFLISWRSQQEIARALGWKCSLMIWGGPALALLSLYVFLSFENLL
jgi:hypothetical protein